MRDIGKYTITWIPSNDDVFLFFRSMPCKLGMHKFNSRMGFSTSPNAIFCSFCGKEQ